MNHIRCFDLFLYAAGLVAVIVLILFIPVTVTWAASNIQISPSKVNVDTKTEITVTAKVNKGQEVVLFVYTDFNADGALNESVDFPLYTFVFTDGPLPALYHPGWVVDTDGAQNGSITAVIPFFDTPHFAGHFLIAVQDSSGKSMAPLAVTAPSTWTQSISGKVEKSGNNRPALVMAIFQIGDSELEYGVITDANGAFQIAVPYEGQYMVGAFAPGSLSLMEGGSGVPATVTGGQTTSLSQSLKLFTGNYTLSGSVRYANQQGVPYLFLIVESEGEGGGYTAPVWSDKNGNFSVKVNAGEGSLTCEYQNMRGIVVEGSGGTVTGNMSGVDIDAAPIEAIISGTVTNLASGSDLHAGLGVYAQNIENDSMSIEDAYTDTDGRYWLGVTAGSWRVEPDSALLNYQDFMVRPPESLQVTIAKNETKSGNDFTIFHSTTVAMVQVREGSIAGQTLANAGVVIQAADTGAVVASGWTDESGIARIPLETGGNYTVSIESNYARGNGYVQNTPVSFSIAEGTQQSVTLVVLKATATIILNAKKPSGETIPNINLVLNRLDGDQFVAAGGGDTDASGVVLLPALAGTYRAAIVSVPSNVAPNGFLSLEREFSITDGQSLSIDLILYLNEAYIQIHTQDRTGQPLSVRFQVFDDSWSSSQEITGGWSDASGTATIPIPAIPLRVAFDTTSAPQLSSPSPQWIQPTPNETVQLFFTFETGNVPQPLSGDINGDRIVDKYDLMILMSQWHQQW